MGLRVRFPSRAHRCSIGGVVKLVVATVSRTVGALLHEGSTPSSPTLAKSYVYVLGSYLGDGCISEAARTFRFRCVQDLKYPNLVRLLARSLKVIFPTNRVHVARRKNESCVVVSCYSSFLVTLFPQHGKGRKHDRKISLKRWQLRLVTRYPKDFIRGLLHTDGCRYVSKIKTRKRVYSYSNYAFSNKSSDIHRLFVRSCELIGVKTRRAGCNTVITQRGSVLLLDGFVERKS